MFQVLSGEDWNAVMYECFRAVGPIAVVFFIVLVVMGNFVMLNLFLAILLAKFEEYQNEFAKNPEALEIKSKVQADTFYQHTLTSNLINSKDLKCKEESK